MLNILYSYIDKEKHTFFLNKELLLMPLDFQQKVLKYKKWENQQASILGRVLLNTLIKTSGFNLSIDHLVYGSNQKPYFKSGKISFNISHTEDIVVCAITDINEIGIDIEKTREIDVYNFKNLLTENEWKFVNNSPNPSDSFIALWTKKEAIIKASGYGLSLNLDSFEIRNDNKTEIKNEPYSVEEIFINEEYRCHVAIKGDLPQILEVKLFI